MPNAEFPPVPQPDRPGDTSAGTACRNADVGMPTGNAFAFERGAVYLGIDPGLNRTGYALIRRGPPPFLLEGGVISSRPKAALAERVREIGEGIRELLEEFSKTQNYPGLAGGLEEAITVDARRADMLGLYPDKTVRDTASQFDYSN